jgi:hypothetical protein
MVTVAGALIIGIAVATRGEIDIWEVFDSGWLRKLAQDREQPKPTGSKDRDESGRGSARRDSERTTCSGT